ncbi:DUF4129 domain-containing protein [Demequina globuliformis]|uniref:DUF4129 domain-containing protein n=1 Tax=Demequina globuliformis TaxID=676202 RepID=UPI0007807A0F|nr:DUF4129 domain-containing protein [Demequina globuliformis]
MLWGAIVDPDADEARRWAEDELSKPEYGETPESWIESVMRWIEDLLSSADGLGMGLPNWLVVIGILAVVALVTLVVWLIVGPMRRSPVGAAGAALNPDDSRSSAQMAAAAHDAGAAENWDLAVMEMFRSTVRGAHERGVIELSPGVTANEAAADLAAVLDGGGAIVPVAHDFETARYGTGGLTRAAWERALAAAGAVRSAHRVEVAAP